jgi:hypothetical protein
MLRKKERGIPTADSWSWTDVEAMEPGGSLWLTYDPTAVLLEPFLFWRKDSEFGFNAFPFVNLIF